MFVKKSGDVSLMEFTKYKAYGSAFLCASFAYASFVLGNNVSRSYYVLLIPAVIFAIISYFSFRNLSHIRLIAELRDTWGKKIERTRDFEVIRRHFDNTPKPQGTIDDRTWSDLDMNVLFSEMDRTFTVPGQQTLYRILRTPIINNEHALRKRNEVLNFFRDNQHRREEIQVVLNKMDERFGEGLSDLLWTSFTVEPSPRMPLFKFLHIAACLSPIAFLISRYGFLLVLAIFLVNMILHFNEQKRIRSHFDSVKALSRLIFAAKQIVALDCEDLQEYNKVCSKALREVEKYQRAVQYVGVETTDPLVGLFQQYIGIFFLSEVRGFYRAIEIIEEKRTEMQQIFGVIGELDALQSVASYRVHLEFYCEPLFIAEKRITIEDAYHPLVADPISNSITADKKGILVTGSNMSGKSTFLRSIGLNALLAQTIFTCHARSYEGCCVQLITCIGRSDNVVEGKSYYLEEALAVRRIIRSLEDRVVTLCILDEMFRGTNSEERITAGHRVLNYIIQRNAIVFVATHDLELTELLVDSYTNVHFSERVGSQGLEFDYKLKTGPSTTKNAIALLRYLEYPKEITDPGMHQLH